MIAKVEKIDGWSQVEVRVVVSGSVTWSRKVSTDDEADAMIEGMKAFANPHFVTFGETT